MRMKAMRVTLAKTPDDGGQGAGSSSLTSQGLKDWDTNLATKPSTYSLSCLQNMLGLKPSRTVIRETRETLTDRNRCRVLQPNISQSSGSPVEKEEGWKNQREQEHLENTVHKIN